MNTLQKVCTVIVVSLALAACTPVGHVFNDEGPSYDDFWTMSLRQTYNVGDNFNRNNDLRVFASAQGIVESIPSNKVNIHLITNPDPDSPLTPIQSVVMLGGSSSENIYRLTDSNVGTGRKLVVVTYGDKTAQYSIEVVDPLGVGGGGGGGENGEGAGVGIIWR